ncbi:MAG: aminotransferase class I/II-fold pyridoxal phosphate-dependent enzyme [bacterium]|nr:aminotransferase class I/II-fold pyridoxal phosphate-dependent enzyme [bacterium]
MKYLKDLFDAHMSMDMYPDVRTIDDVPYPEFIIKDKRYICLCSNNYLGLSIHPEVKEAALEGVKRYGIGTCESRIIAGNMTVFEDLERTIAKFKNTDAAMVFATGFMTNIGVIPAIMDDFGLPGFPSIKNEDNLIIGDVLNHMSIIDGCRLSRAHLKSYLHKDMGHLESILERTKAKRKLIITDGVFSMDGDLAPLPKILELAKRYDAMVMIDDAHATGVIGENGRGTSEYFGVEGEVDWVMGTLSKAIGAIGGYLTGSFDLLQMLRMRTHSYIFSSGVPPEQACGIMAALKIIKEQPELRKRFWENVNHLKGGLKKAGFDIMDSETQIIPVLVGDERKCIEMARLLFDKGIIAPCLRWPAVPPGKSRIRCTTIATHTKPHIEYAIKTFYEIGKKLDII